MIRICHVCLSRRFIDCGLFLVGSVYFVAGSYPEESLLGDGDSSSGKKVEAVQRANHHGVPPPFKHSECDDDDDDVP